jgi:hypothetical protein
MSFDLNAQLQARKVREAAALQADNELLNVLITEIAVRAILADVDLSDVAEQFNGQGMLAEWQAIATSREVADDPEAL